MPNILSSNSPTLPPLLRVGTAMAVLLAASCAHTTSTAPNGAVGYLSDSKGVVVRNSTNECVRTGTWQPGVAVKEWDPALVQQAEAPVEQPAVAAAPAEPAASDTEEPATVQAEPVRIYVGTDAYFEFDQSELTSQAKRNLDAIAERAQNANDATIRVVGYADAIGENDYNLSLSQRRADAVRVYLIERGVPETMVSMEALGETDPVVGCEGRQGASLIDCLQPNRRTEVEFSALESP